ncbi:MAG: tRNA (guanosine(37)-N1)-methyltransferase TrmD [Proteobacteria bacterium]|nr:tRNA (guanosine(37)-N1)-methyltransferase TrmD [Pseudomonadota bacterium]
MRHICFVSLFPEYFEAAMGCSIMGRAVARGVLDYSVVQIRDFSLDRHRRVDDAPYGGGAGLVMKPEPMVAAIESARSRCQGGRVVLMTPQGAVFSQQHARRLSRETEALILVCGHYEGVDERVSGYVDEEMTIGDYVLTGGELAALVVGDAVCRLWPGVLGNEASAVEESFSEGWLEYPQYTRPACFRGEAVPSVLLGGHHGEVARWRRCQSIERTRERRPELFEQLLPTLSLQERVWTGLEPAPPKVRRRHGNHGVSSSDGQKTPDREK